MMPSSLNNDSDYGVHSSFSFDMLPEELTERILSLCVSASLTPPPPRPSWHTPKSSPSPPSPSSPLPSARRCHSDTSSLPNPNGTTTFQPRTRLSPLLVCKSFQRIALPHYYSTIHINSSKQALSLLNTLRANEHFGTYVRRVCVTGFFAGIGEVLRVCGNVIVLDLSLDAGAVSSVPAPVGAGAGAGGGIPAGPPTAAAVEADGAMIEFCDALDGLRNVRHLTLRKPSNVYLTQGRVRNFITRLAATIERWTLLESVDVAFRMSDDTPAALLTSPLGPTLVPLPVSAPTTPTPVTSSPTKRGPISQLTSALSLAPSLRVFSTHLPSLWNEAILCISRNPSLQRIVLGDERTASVGGGVMPTGLYMTEAKKHPRLTELIRAGTPMVRTRAHTMGYFVPCPYYRMGQGSGAPLHKGEANGTCSATESGSANAASSSSSPSSSASSSSSSSSTYSS